MTAIKGVFRGGKIEFAPPPDWPEGCEVVVEPVGAEPAPGMPEEDWPTTPDGIAALRFMLTGPCWYCDRNRAGHQRWLPTPARRGC